MSRLHSHPKYLQWFKSGLAIFAFVYPAYLLLTSTSSFALIRIIEVFLAIFIMIIMLVTAYFFQDIWVDEEGLQIEFLWKKIRVKWEEIIEVKPAWGFLGSKKNRPLIVLVNGLTPFHRAFGVIYGLSTKPGFVIFSSINDFQILKENIQNHLEMIKSN